jgi:hypothetical protein
MLRGPVSTRSTSRSIVLGALFIASAATADTTKRVVLADTDPELRQAVELSLRPWRIEVIVDANAPTDLATARTRADVGAARFVVWREGAELVVFDRERELSERRTVRVGSLDPLSAEAAALSIKTMMRLPPLEPGDPVTATVPQSDGIELRFEAGAGPRYEQGLDGNVALRFAAGAMVKPWRDRGWRVGVIGDFGASATVDQAGFKGTWSNWAALGYASWTLTRGPWELEPWAAIGAERSSLDGTEMATARSEHTTLAVVRGGIAGRRRVGIWSVGLIVALEGVVGAPTYTKLNAPADVFEVPSFGVLGSLVFATDLVP